MPTTLLPTPTAIIDALVREADACGPDDRIDASVYIVEPGVSSERVIAALRDAVARGARVRLAVDWTAASHLSRLVERATTLLPRLEALARETPGFLVVRRRTPDHTKWFTFRRTHAPSAAIISSLNLGDRFAEWRDLGARVEGEHLLDGLDRALRGDGPDTAAAVRELVTATTAFVTNVPARGRWDVRPTLAALVDHPALTRLQVAVAYVDQTGAALLERALARGATVDLLLPSRANVYQHANLRAHARLLAAGARARLVPGMLHAKALVAHDSVGPRAGWLGSPNLKRNSFRLFAELALCSTEPPFVAELARALDALADGATLADAPLPFVTVRAWVEERLG